METTKGPLEDEKALERNVVMEGWGGFDELLDCSGDGLYVIVHLAISAPSPLPPNMTGPPSLKWETVTNLLGVDGGL